MMAISSSFLLFTATSIHAQDFIVEAGNPLSASKCGPIVSLPVTVLNDSNTDGIAVEGEVELPTGVALLSTSANVTLSGNTVGLGNILVGDSISFELFVQVNCDFTEDDFVYSFDITQGGTGFMESDATQVVFGDISITNSDPGTLGVYLGSVDSVTSTVVNNGFGQINEVTYCVNTPSNLGLQSILVGGVDITAGGSTVQNGLTCYTITSPALIAAGVGPTLDQAEVITVKEVWETTGCTEDPDDIVRRAHYGCQGVDDCLMKPQEDFTATGVSYLILAPDIELATVSAVIPDCPFDERTTATIRLTNTGNAPAKNIRTRVFFEGGPMALDLSSVMAVYDADSSAFTDITMTPIGNVSACNGGAPLTTSISFNNVNLGIGESISLSYELFASCACNDCSIRGLFYHRFNLTGFDDLCDEDYDKGGGVAPFSRYSAFLEGFPEAPSVISQTGSCVSYFVTNGQLDWLNDENPNAYMDIAFNVGCGLDVVPGSFAFRDAGGNAWMVSADSISITTGPGDTDTLKVRITPDGRPTDFEIGGGMSFEYCVEPDCSEKPPAVCFASNVSVPLSARFDFTINPDCSAACSTQKIWLPDDLNVQIVCPPLPQNCPPGQTDLCDGIQFQELTIKRINYGLGDTDNDQEPDGAIDVNNIESGRYIQGDTLQVTAIGNIVDDSNLDFDHGFFVLPMLHEDFAVISAEVKVTDATDGMVYTCTDVPFTTRLSGDSSNVRVDFSVAALNAQGCGLPAMFSYDPGDEIEVNVVFKDKNQTTEDFTLRVYEPDFFVSEDDFGVGTEYSCSSLFGRMIQVGISTRKLIGNSNFGACDTSPWQYLFDRHIGGFGLDEFPNEVRTIGIPDRFIFTKPAEFSHRTDLWTFRLRQTILPERSIVPSTTIPSEYLVVSGDQVTFLIKDYLESLGLASIPTDEGYRFAINPRIQGTCASAANTFNYNYELIEDVDVNIFCREELVMNDDLAFDYLGGARLIALTDRQIVRLCSANDMVTVRVRNVEIPGAINSFLYPEFTGGVLVNRIEDAVTGAEIVPNEFGIYELGNIDGVSERELHVYFTKNSCSTETINFIAGYDCEGYPEAINDAICTDPSPVTLTSANSNVDMIVEEPAPATRTIISLCDPVPYLVDFISTDLGYVRDMVLTFKLPPNQTYDTGSFQFAYPHPNQGGTLMSVPDPTPLGGNRYRIDLSALDSVLNVDGLVGSKDPLNSTMQIAFNTLTDCGFISGSRATFILKSKNSCGDNLRPVRRKSGQVRTRNRRRRFRIRTNASDVNLNACDMDVTTVSNRLVIRNTTTTTADSVRIILPEGVLYIPNSYVPGTNAEPGMNPTVISQASGQTILSWPFVAGLTSGDVIQFDVDVRVEDIGQACTEYELLTQAFITETQSCNGMTCNVSNVVGERALSINLQKADLDFRNVGGTITLNPTTNEATADFSFELCNFGFPLMTGATVEVDFYEDSNLNGSYDPGTDAPLFTITDVLTADLNTGECVTYSGTEVFMATDICSVIGVISPEKMCTCSENPSNVFRPTIVFDIDQEYEVCSNDMINIGPDPVAGYEFDWVSLNGSDVSLITPSDNTPSVFNAPTNTGESPIELQYALRSSNAPCFADDTITITIYPTPVEVVSVEACAGTSFDLPTVDNPDAINYVWSADPPLMPGELTISPDGKFATVNSAPSMRTYTLNYELGGTGCPGSLEVNLTDENCMMEVTELGDYVWFDIDQDGEQDTGEPPVEGVVVNLLNEIGAVISTTTTDANGMYLFDDLPAGDYAVEFIAPDGFVFTTNDTGSTDENDSDADPNTGITPTNTLNLGDQDYTYDAGFIPNCNLEVSVVASECTADPVNGGFTRNYTISVNWTGNPYAYDQFGDGQDTIDITFMGMNYEIIVDDVNGMDALPVISSNATGTFTVDAVFKEANSCMATAETGPFDLCEFDLALKKTPSEVMPTPGPYSYGDLVCYDITVYNQGSQTVSNVHVIDELPAGLEFNAANSPGWNDISPQQFYIIQDPIEPQDSVVLTMCANIVMTEGDADAYTNYAEIRRFSDENGNDRSGFDIDSTPDDDSTNDTGGNPNDGTNDQVDDDGTVDEDDHDPHRISVFDLALIKTLDTPAPYVAGQTVSYTIQVVNQGNEPASDIEVTDYVPAGFTALASNMPTWGAPTPISGNRSAISTTIAGPLAPGDTTSVTVDLQLTGAPSPFDADNYTNFAEITDGTNDNTGTTGNDIDSDTDSNPDNDAGGSPDTDTDDSIEGNGNGSPGSTNADTDEDDHDPASIVLDTLSLGSTVFIDADDNGMQDPTEDGISGVTVELLLDADGNGMIDADEMTPVATTTTDANGDYYFGELIPGNYVVQIPEANFGDTGALDEYSTSSTPTSTTDDNNDGDDNGIQAGGPLTTTMSPVINLMPGEEPVAAAETFQGGGQDVDNGQADDSGNMTVDFGFIPNVTIGSTVFADYNNNGIQDPGEPGIPGVELVLFYDADNDGMITGTESTPITSTTTDANGNYFMQGLITGNYQVGILDTEFTTGEGLEYGALSSTDIGTTADDNNVDGDDNGLQPGGVGTPVLSPIVTLTLNGEPTNGGDETEQGNNADMAFDANGNMTIDFGFICIAEMSLMDAQMDLCSSRKLDIASLVTVTPASLVGTWETSGDGMFLSSGRNEVSPATSDAVMYYMAGPEDAKNGQVTLTLVVNAIGCPVITDQITVDIIKVGCGGFPWNGRN